MNNSVAALPNAIAPAQRDAPVLLSIRGVSKTFESATQSLPALQPIDLEVREGEFVVFFGPSGCGKSTLLNMIAGFTEPTQGTILLAGKQVDHPGPDRLMLFQEPGLFPWLNVIDNVTYGLRRKPGYRFRPRARCQRGRDLLALMHLQEFEKSLIHELSGGMKQRVALARALAPEPKILLIDEPFPALDALARARLYLELQEILVRTNKTILSVTHDPNEAACLGHRVVVFSGRPGAIKSQITVALPRPREISDPRVTAYGAEIMAQLEEVAGA